MHSSGSTTIGTGNFGRGLRGFDYITSISEASINAMFAVLWKHARDDKTTLENILLQWSYEGVFSSTFEAIKVELLSESKIIVRINITEGSMTLKGYVILSPKLHSSFLIIRIGAMNWLNLAPGLLHSLSTSN
jgi:hypothetical protein